MCETALVEGETTLMEEGRQITLVGGTTFVGCESVYKGWSEWMTFVGLGGMGDWNCAQRWERRHWLNGWRVYKPLKNTHTSEIGRVDIPRMRLFLGLTSYTMEHITQNSGVIFRRLVLYWHCFYRTDRCK